jgi:hypothetical protein
MMSKQIKLNNMTKILTGILILIGLIFLGNCTKEDNETPKSNNKIYSIEDVPMINGRDGVKPIFAFTSSDVIYNPWDSSQVAFNKRLVLNTKYLRMGNDEVEFIGIYWGDYLITKRFTTGDSIMIRAWAPLFYGDNFTIESNLFFNQLDFSANDKFVKVKQTKRSVEYYDIKCTKKKRKYNYLVSTDNYSGAELLQPRKCNTNAFSFDLVY